METITDPDNIFFGRVPITPIMDTQLDQIVIQDTLIPLKQQVLKELQTKIFKKDRSNWFELFITIFLLLNNIEIATAHDHEFAVLYGRYVSFVCNYMSQLMLSLTT